MNPDFQLQTLANGFRLATATLPASECVSLGFFIPVGSRHDPITRAGLAHFMEHMSFKGTARRDAKTLSQELEQCGAQANASTGEDYTVYDARGDAASLPIISDILCDMIWHSSLPPKEIQLEREVIHEEITMYEESPSDHINDLISQALWAPDPLGNRITGTHDTLKRITRNDLFTFHQTHHFRNDIVVAAAGPYSADEFKKIINPYLPELTHEAPATAAFTKKPQEEPLIDYRDTEQCQLAIAYHTCGRRSPERHALRLLSIILGESSSSRLFQRLREERGLCYAISSDIALFEDTGCLEIIAGLDPESIHEATQVILTELSDLAKNGPTQAELDKAKNISRTAQKLALESTPSHMSWVGESVMIENRIITPAEARANLDPITCEEIRILSAKIFQASNHTLAQICPVPF